MRKLMVYLKPHKIAVTTIVVFIFAQCLLNLYLPTLMSKIVDNGVLKGNIQYIWEMGLVMLAVSIGAVVFSVAAGFISSKTAADFGRVLRREVFTHATQFTFHEFDEFGASSLITRTTNDITQVQQLVTMMLRMMIMAPLNCIGGILMAVYTDAKLSLIIVVIMPFLALTIYLVFRNATALFRAMQIKIDTLNRILRENLSGIRVIRSFNRVAYEARRFDLANLDLTDTTTKVQKIMAAMLPVLMLIINGSTIAIIWFGGIRINDGLMQVGSLIAFTQYVMQLLFAIMMVSMMFFMVPRAMASATRINQVLDTIPEIRDPDKAECRSEGDLRDPDRVSTAAATTTDSGLLQFQDVTFTYPGAETPALSNISFTAYPGQVTAIIGGTGAGKSTLVSLIPRFYEVSTGKILVDGVDIREVRQADLRAKIGYVPQKAILFSGTIEENIRFGKEDATLEEVRHAARVAQASSFIDEMSGSYDAFIEQGGRNVSGGQKQRLSIARALVKQPEIYIFDDSFSALDFKTDAQLRRALKPEVVDRTVLIVAQRVNTVRDADQIIVLHEGEIAGIGSHEELIRDCSVYREIVASQLSEEEIA